MTLGSPIVDPSASRQTELAGKQQLVDQPLIHAVVRAMDQLVFLALAQRTGELRAERTATLERRFLRAGQERSAFRSLRAAGGCSR
jgi:hypothetical protein